VASGGNELSDVLPCQSRLAFAAAEVSEGESQQGLSLCPRHCRYSYRESADGDCSGVKETACLDGRFCVRKATGGGVCSHEGVAG